MIEIIDTEISEVKIISPKVFGDSRGYFFESYNKKDFETAGLHHDFIQDNQSFSHYGTLRGLHYQKGEFAQAKLVRVVVGKILDVAVDIRKNSPSFGQHVAVELSEDNKLQLLLPRGFAHGFSVLSETAIVQYKCDNVYNKESEGGILYNDPKLAIQWQIPEDKIILSDKDKANPPLSEAKL
tara:strand:+ start:17908 stop:18453 length:546 start_codon:yes stop_codon:yes gene_type:complete